MKEVVVHPKSSFYHGDYTFRHNRLVLCGLAICFMWATSLKVATYIVTYTHTVNSPSYEWVYTSCKGAWKMIQKEQRQYTNCNQAQIQTCHDHLITTLQKELYRIQLDNHKNDNIIQQTKQRYQSCSTSYSNWQHWLEQYIHLFLSPPQNNNNSPRNNDPNDESPISLFPLPFHDHCTPKERSHILAQTTNLKQTSNSSTSSLFSSMLQSQAISLSTDYSRHSQSTVHRLTSYARLRADYDRNYMKNQTLHVETAVDNFIQHMQQIIPDTSMDWKFLTKIDTDIHTLLTCISFSEEKCPYFPGLQAHMERFYGDIDQMIHGYKDEIKEFRTNVNQLKQNILDAYKTSSTFYYGAYNVILYYSFFFFLNTYYYYE